MKKGRCGFSALAGLLSIFLAPLRGAESVVQPVTPGAPSEAVELLNFFYRISGQHNFPGDTDRNACELSVPLKFLGAGNWRVSRWEDAPDADQNAEHLVKNEKTVGPSDTLQLKLAPSGGTVAILSPAN
jgi:hypothetical protein